MELTQIRLLVTDFPAVYRFYRDVLGLKPQFDAEQGPYAKLSPDGGSAAIALQDRAQMAGVLGELGGEVAGYRGLVVLRVDDLDAAYRELAGRGAKFLREPAAMGDRIRVAHLADPEGNLIELQEWLALREQAAHGSGERAVPVDTRIGPPNFGSEREMLRAFLDFHRATLAMKCDGLSDEELRQQSMAPSTLSLLGLVRHMAEVERAWFRRVFEDHEAPMVWSEEIDFQAAYDASGSTRAEAFGAWEAEVENSRRIEREAESLDLGGYQPRWEEEVSLRMVMVHVLLEYGRHNGHADFLREGVDGTVGA